MDNMNIVSNKNIMTRREYKTFQVFARRMLQVNIITKEEYDHIIQAIEEKRDQLYSSNIM